MTDWLGLNFRILFYYIIEKGIKAQFNHYFGCLLCHSDLLDIKSVLCLYLPQSATLTLSIKTMNVSPTNDNELLLLELQY